MEENENNIQPTIDTVEQPYDPASLENIKRVLDMSLKAGRPQSFEIEVDGLRVVQRTPVLEMFDTYKTFIHPTTRKIIVTVYRGVRTPACTKHVFSRDNDKPLNENLGNVQQQTTTATPPGFLSGTEVKQMMQDMLEKERMNNRIVSLEEKLDDREKKVKEAEDYIMRLQTGIETLRQEVQSKGSQLLDKFMEIAKNPPDWIKLLILQNSKDGNKGLSGTDDSEEEEVTIRKKQPALTEEEKEFVELMHRMEEKLEEDDYGLLIMINDKLIENEELIEKVADLIDVKLPEE
ncbi:MAG TPA: hypothetical protein PK637_13340 [Flavobacteriales bacterium]|nr:hypothetical protein [Flavobacteriales bacterium]HRJ39377.1 hypothetical protein [Flavobacteriales bacterium]